MRYSQPNTGLTSIGTGSISSVSHHRKTGTPRKHNKTANIRSLAVWFLALGMPLLLGKWFMSDEDTRQRGLFGVSFLAWITICLMILYLPVLIFHFRASLRQKTHRAFYAYFASVGFGTIAASLLGSAPATREQLISLVLLFIWSTTFITGHFLVRSIEEYRRAIRLMDIAGFLIGLSVIAAYVGPQFYGVAFGEYSNKEGMIRAFGPFGDQVGFALGYFALRAIVQARFPLIVLYVVAILLTGTVGAYVSLGVGIAWLLLRGTQLASVQLQIKRQLVVLTCVGVSVMVGFLYSSYGETGRMRILDTVQGMGSVQQRLASMSLGWKVFADNPLGVGYQGFSRLGLKYGFADTFGDVRTSATFTTNNQYLQTAVDGGIPALCVLVVFLWLIYRVISGATHRVEKALSIDLVAGLAWLVGIAVGNQSSVWLLTSNITSLVFFLVFGVLLRAASWPSNLVRPLRQSSAVRTNANARR